MGRRSSTTSCVLEFEERHGPTTILVVDLPHGFAELEPPSRTVVLNARQRMAEKLIHELNIALDALKSLHEALRLVPRHERVKTRDQRAHVLEQILVRVHPKAVKSRQQILVRLAPRGA